MKTPCSQVITEIIRCGGEWDMKKESYEICSVYDEDYNEEWYENIEEIDY